MKRVFYYIGGEMKGMYEAHKLFRIIEAKEGLADAELAKAIMDVVKRYKDHNDQCRRYGGDSVFAVNTDITLERITDKNYNYDDDPQGKDIGPGLETEVIAKLHESDFGYPQGFIARCMDTVMQQVDAGKKAEIIAKGPLKFAKKYIKDIDAFMDKHPELYPRVDPLICAKIQIEEFVERFEG